MGSNRSSVDIDALLAERDAVQRLALRLVGDPDRAEDLTQEAMLVGLEHGQRAQSGIGAWLNGVTRRLAQRSGRAHVRRRRREELAARPIRIPATDELLVRTREQRRVLGHLGSLEEPYRTVVLLRYFEDLPPRRIAEELGVPVATVKSRLHRGLARLRGRLDEDHGGNRSKWTLALVPAALPAGQVAAATALVTGGLLMGTKAKILTSAAVLLLAAGTWWGLSDGGLRPDEPGNGQPSPPLLVDVGGEAGLEGRPVRSEDAASAAPEESPREGVETTEVIARWRGRVIDEQRRPVVGAEVVVRRQGRVVKRFTTDEQGQYRVRLVLDLPVGVDLFTGLPPVPSMSLWATTSDGRTGHGRLYPSVGISDLERPLAPIVVAGAVPISARVVAGGEPVSGARASLIYRPDRQRAQQVHVATVTTDADGLAVFPGVPAGICSIFAVAEGHGPAVITSLLPAGPKAVLEIELPALRWKAVRVVEVETRTPIAEAEVRMSVRPPDRGPSWAAFAPVDGVEPTDADGRTRVPLFGPGVQVWLQAASADHPIQTMGPGRTAELDPDLDEIVIELPAPTEYRWEVKGGEGAAPGDGTIVRLLDARTSFSVPGYRIPSNGHIEGGFLVVRNVVLHPGLEFAVVAVLPDGRAAHAVIPKDEEVGPPVSFVRLRKITARVLDADGEPVRGVHFSTQGQPQALRNAVRGSTDETGTCVLQPFLPLPTKICIFGSFQRLGRTWKDVDLTDGDREVEFRFAPNQALRVRIHIDGEPALPMEWVLKLGQRTHVNQALVSEDPEKGEILVNIATEAPLVGMTAVLEVPGLPPATGTIEAGPDGATVLLEVESRGILRARIVPPSDGRYEFVLQRWAPEYAYWYTQNASGGKRVVGENRLEFSALAAGRWRAYDELSGVHSEPIDLVPARGARELVLDLRDTGFATGRVHVPEGTNMEHVRVLPSGNLTRGARPPKVQTVGVEAPAPPPFVEPPGSIRVSADGTFQLRVSGRDDITLRAWHPTLSAEASVVVRAPQEGVALRLRAGPTTRITLAPGLEARHTQRVAYRVLLLDAAGELLHTCYPTRSGTTLRFAGYEPGRYTLWIDGGLLAPTVLPGIVLGDGETQLENVAFGPGSTVDVTILGAKDDQMPFLRLRAEATGEPAYIRSTMGRGPKLVLEGLGRGRFKFMVRDMMGGAKILHESEIEVDGTAAQKITIDLR